MHSNPHNEHELVKMCMAELCARAGLPDPGSMVQRDMVILSDTIESNTGVLISLSTIKRLLNGQFSRLPQVATLDAIAQSAGYQHWRNFTLAKAARPGTVPIHPETAPATGIPKTIPLPRRPKVPAKARYLMAGLALILLSATTLIILMSQKPGPSNIDKAHFSATKVTGNDIPNTVIFKYNVDSVTADSFFIQQSWDISRRVRVYKHNYTLTDIYYEPGYHTAKLIADDKIIRTLPVSIPTDRWLFYSIEKIRGSRPKYITHLDTGMLKLSTEEIINSKIDIQKDNVYCNTWFPSGIEYSSDNFTLKCRVRIKPVNNESCPLLMCEIYCQNYFMYFKSTVKGCTGELTAQFGENELNGRSNDLSGLGADLRTWQDLEFTVKDKKVAVSINGKKTFTSAYTRSAGLITGIGFISNGISEVQWVDLRTADGTPIYQRGVK
ncbi:MAG TPA: hypothetical protein VHC96_14455 [Puia sp.]|nr:hypothetical protein [Puia sp.]